VGGGGVQVALSPPNAPGIRVLITVGAMLGVSVGKPVAVAVRWRDGAGVLVGMTGRGVAVTSSVSIVQTGDAVSTAVGVSGGLVATLDTVSVGTLVGVLVAEGVSLGAWVTDGVSVGVIVGASGVAVTGSTGVTDGTGVHEERSSASAVSVADSRWPMAASG
jgi:hypothetical protein